MKPPTKIAISAAVVLLAGALLYLARSSPSDSASASDAEASDASVGPATANGPIATNANDDDAQPSPVGRESEGDDAGKRALFSARWGSARGELGRDRPQEGNPEGPLSLALAGDDLLVLDQVNGRLARYGRDGRLLGTSDAPATVQDIAVGADGTVAMVDRLVGKAVTLVDANGRKIGELGLSSRVAEPGLVTGVVVDGKNVYVEKEHGALVLLGATDGTPAEEPSELAGRPSKDGALLLTAGMNAPRDGRAYLNAIDRKSGALRFARVIQFPRPSRAIVMLDSDAKGTIYLGVAAGDPGDAHIACLDPGDGHVLGRIVLPLSHTPEESFRDFTVGSDGTIVFALRNEDGVAYHAARCP